MEAGSTVYQRTRQRYALLVEILIELGLAGWQAVAHAAGALERMRRQAQARRELRSLSDRSLADIGLDRHQIDRLFD
jgi:uncharacterized protein YjiS (DUF1127 family)